MSRLSIKDYNEYMEQLTTRREQLQYQIDNYKDSLNILQQKNIEHKIEKINKQIIDLKKRFKQSVPENFQRTEGFKINYGKKYYSYSKVLV